MQPVLRFMQPEPLLTLRRGPGTCDQPLVFPQYASRVKEEFTIGVTLRPGRPVAERLGQPETFGVFAPFLLVRFSYWAMRLRHCDSAAFRSSLEAIRPNPAILRSKACHVRPSRRHQSA